MVGLSEREEWVCDSDVLCHSGRSSGGYDGSSEPCSSGGSSVAEFESERRGEERRVRGVIDGCTALPVRRLPRLHCLRLLPPTVTTARRLASPTR